jgi:hypothetical protein
MIFYEEILTAFQKNKVDYMIVGGIALNLLGGMRTTSDLDVVLALTDSNLKKVVTILKKLKYRVKIPVDPMGIADEEQRNDWIKNKNMKAMNFYKTSGPGEVDIIISTPASYQQMKKNKVYVKVGALNLPVISIDDLIKMKKKAARPIDKSDIIELSNLKKFERA